MTRTDQLLQAALRLARAGWAVFPLKPGDKNPITKHGFKEASTDEQVIASWWDGCPLANVGVATGEASGVVVVDVDGPAGEESWALLEQEHGHVETLEQRTGREDGGRQLFFAHPGGRWPNRTGWRPGLDLRGDGGYVVAPPSQHPSGKRYEWLSQGRPAPMPGWLQDLLRAPKPAPPPAAAAPPPPATDPSRTSAIESTPWGLARLEANAQIVRGAAQGNRNATLNTAAFKVGQAIGAGELDEEEARAELWAAASVHNGVGDWSEKEARKTLESGLRKGMAQPRGPSGARVAPPSRASSSSTRSSSSTTSVPSPSPPTPPAGDTSGTAAAAPASSAKVEGEGDDTYGAWREDLLVTRDEIPRVRAVLPNAVLFVRYLPGLRGRLVWDERYLRAEWIAPGPPWDEKGPRPLEDSDAVEASRWLAAEEGIAFGHETLFTVMTAEAHQRPLNRVKAYLAGLEWDGQPRVDSWLIDLLGAVPGDAAAGVVDDWTRYCKAAGAAWLISAIARAMNPGCQVDHMIILEGEQGTLKSSSLAALGGPFYSELTLDVGGKDTLLDIHGPWIVEWSELAGLSKREAESVKAFISRRSDRFRPPYGKSSGDFPRDCVFAGTTNEAISLSDATGNRRYWPIHVDGANPKAVEAARDQLWAEALFRWKCGERWWFDADIERLARIEQEARLEVDAWESTIVYALEEGTLHKESFVTTADLFKALDLQSAQQNTGAGRRLNRIMDRLGWTSERARIGGSRPRGYRRPGRLFDLDQMGAKASGPPSGPSPRVDQMDQMDQMRKSSSGPRGAQ